MEDVKFVDKHIDNDFKPRRDSFVFKVLSIGSFNQDLPDNVTYLNRPQISVDGLRKKWGNEYILFNKTVTNPTGLCFLGSFGIDKKKRMNVHMFKCLDVPVKKPDYYIITIDHTTKFDKTFDIIKYDPQSFSKVFSSAYHFYESENRYMCQSMLIVQHGDKVMVDGQEYVFSGKSEVLE